MADTIIDVSSDSDDEPILVSDDDDDEDEDEEYMRVDDEADKIPLLVELATKGRTQQFSLPNGHDLPLVLLYRDRIETYSNLLSNPRESLHTVAAEVHWDAAFLAHLLIDMPVPECKTNLHTFLDGCACVAVRENPHFTIILK